MLKRIHNQRDFLAGAMFTGIGLISLYETSGLQFGTLSNIGPGFFPFILALVSVAFGGAIVIRSLASAERSEPLSISWRAMTIAVAAILFGVLIDPLGFIPALIALIVISSFADPSLTWIDTIKLVVGLSVGSVIVFVYLLKQPIELFGPFLTAF